MAFARKALDLVLAKFLWAMFTFTIREADPARGITDGWQEAKNLLPSKGGAIDLGAASIVFAFRKGNIPLFQFRPIRVKILAPFVWENGTVSGSKVLNFPDVETRNPKTDTDDKGRPKRYPFIIPCTQEIRHNMVLSAHRDARVQATMRKAAAMYQAALQAGGATPGQGGTVHAEIPLPVDQLNAEFDALSAESGGVPEFETPGAELELEPEGLGDFLS
jgi:hypothetical protein